MQPNELVPLLNNSTFYLKLNSFEQEQIMIMNNNNSDTNSNMNQPKEINQEVSTTEYTNLFRGVSSLMDLRGLSTLELDPNALENNSNNEKTHDLSELILNEQTLQAAANKNTSPKLILTQMNPVTFNVVKMETPDISYQQITKPVPAVAESTSHSITTRRINLKRLPVTSSSSIVDKTSQISKRGRKPNSQTGAHLTPSKAKLLKKQQEAQKPVVYFGNKVVEKETDEYFKRRENNNVAVKKCREKGQIQQREREERMSRLENENSRLSGIVDSQTKELNVLKNILIQMSPMKKLPENIEVLLKGINH